MITTPCEKCPHVEVCKYTKNVETVENAITETRVTDDSHALMTLDNYLKDVNLYVKIECKHRGAGAKSSEAIAAGGRK